MKTRAHLLGIVPLLSVWAMTVLSNISPAHMQVCVVTQQVMDYAQFFLDWLSGNTVHRDFLLQHPLMLMFWGISMTVQWCWLNLHDAWLSLHDSLGHSLRCYADLLQKAMLCFMLATMFQVGRSLYRVTERWLPVLLVQIAPWLFFESMIAVSQPVFLWCEMVTLWLIACLIAPVFTLYVPRTGDLVRWSTRLGVVLGLCLSVDWQLWPLLGIAWFLPSTQARSHALGIALVCAAIAFLPAMILQAWPIWIAPVANWSFLYHTLLHNPLFPMGMALLLGSAHYFSQPHRAYLQYAHAVAKLLRLVVIVSCVALAQVLLYGQTLTLVACMMLMAFCLALVTHYLLRYATQRHQRLRVKGAIIAAVVGIVGMNGIAAVGYMESHPQRCVGMAP
ncbi:MAG: hypothetical protein V4490_02510 [Pseudomonadota bacterium]